MQKCLSEPTNMFTKTSEPPPNQRLEREEFTFSVLLIMYPVLFMLSYKCCFVLDGRWLLSLAKVEYPNSRLRYVGNAGIQ